MLIMYGWGNKLKKDVPMGMTACGSCGQFQQRYLGRVVFRVHICYIPIFWKTKGYYIFCGNCERGQEISREQYEIMKPVFRTFTNKKLLKDCYDSAVKLSYGMEASEQNVEQVFTQLAQSYPIATHELIAQQYKAMIFDIMRYRIVPANLLNG